MRRFGEASRGAGLGFEAQEALDDAFGDLVVEFNRAVERLLTVPAPDAAALAVKIALAVDEQAWELPAGAECMAALKRDGERMSTLRRGGG